MANTISKLQLDEACDRLTEALQDLAAQCSGFGIFLESEDQTRETALEVQGPVRGAALQVIEMTRDYLTAIAAYADSLPS